jgi:hypothetical protein
VVSKSEKFTLNLLQASLNDFICGGESIIGSLISSFKTLEKCDEKIINKMNK